MKKVKILLMICVILFPLIWVLPIPRRLKDGGTLHLKPILPMYELYIYNTKLPDKDGGVMYKKGYGIHLFGIAIYEKLYYTNLE